MNKELLMILALQCPRSFPLLRSEAALELQGCHYSALPGSIFNVTALSGAWPREGTSTAPKTTETKSGKEVNGTCAQTAWLHRHRGAGATLMTPPRRTPTSQAATSVPLQGESHPSTQSQQGWCLFCFPCETPSAYRPPFLGWVGERVARILCRCCPELPCAARLPSLGPPAQDQ